MKRRLRSAALVATALTAVWVAPAVHGQAWPSRAVRVVVPFPPGGGLDFFARVLAVKLQENIGQQIIVDNRSGGGGMIGADVVSKAVPDGYTVLFSSAAEITINQHLYSKMSYDPVRDLAPVSYAAHAALLFATHPSIPAKSVKDLVALAHARPGQLSYASAGTGGVQHLAGELFRSAAKIDIVHIPYKGAGPAVIDMVGGQVPMGFTALPSSLPHARAGRLRALAVTSGKRSESAPELPTFVELGYPAIDIVSWYGVLVPARTPREVITKLSADVVRSVQSADVKAKLLQQGVESVGTTPEQFGQFIQSEIARYGNVVRDSGAKAD